MKKRRVVITGLGVFSGSGTNVPAFTDALLNGVSGIGPLDLFDVAPFPSRIGCQVKNYEPRNYFDKTTARKLSRADQFAVIAAGEALTDSGISGSYSAYEMGVSMGAGAAGMFQAEQWLKSRLAGQNASPDLLRGILPDTTTTVLAKTFGLAGYQGSVTTACSSSATAIGWGADLIATGQQKAVLVGGSDTLSLLTFAGFNSLKVIDTEPCSPFSLGRQGISLGEGAACLVLEDEDEARARGAKIYGEILGYAIAGEAWHMTAPEPSGVTAARVMREALLSAGLETGQVGWVNAHGTGTPLNDVVESNAMKLVFGNHAADVPLVSTKAMTGHCLGAAGAIEALATVIALNQRIIPQTLNFRGSDPECDLDYCHEGQRPTDCRIAISNSFAFGGNITSLVLAL
ncbi:MAG: beta-ketoacyl-[acyl-carrier-protein] synthase family protein [Geobacteraceae bacterium]|nr:beta-ketoacyl-[acyl-carrier-protein] synthase family protein [Geobacteraceae bacterium]NTW80301.1 beta-ketoacyl-[acyl-carrier-protein] synthase family protein [Geobacteraceae bacterium]